MGKIVFAMAAIGVSFALIVYREQVGDMFGEAEWMKKVGGVYNVIIICAILLFFWGVAALTGTERNFFEPLLMLIPGYNPTPPPDPTYIF